MKFFGQLWFILGLTTCMLFGITVACQGDDECNKPNGVCTEGVCECEPEYTGTACEHNNPCKDETCSDQGTCEPSDDDTPVAVCTCNAGFIGDKCEIVDPCHTETCNNQGTCNPSDDTTPVAVCTCNPGFTGTKCETDIDECAPSDTDAHDCNANAACTNTPPGSYTCTCNEGFVGDGKTCTEGVCSAGGNECANGGTCVTSTTPTKCSCADGYTGDTCQNAGGTVKISGFLMTLTVLTFFVIL